MRPKYALSVERLTTLYVLSQSEKHDLTIEESKNLLNVVNLSVCFKKISKSDFVENDKEWQINGIEIVSGVPILSFNIFLSEIGLNDRF